MIKRLLIFENKDKTFQARITPATNPIPRRSLPVLNAEFEATDEVFLLWDHLIQPNHTRFMDIKNRYWGITFQHTAGAIRLTPSWVKF